MLYVFSVFDLYIAINISYNYIGYSIVINYERCEDEMEKPKILYRGIELDYNSLTDYNFYDDLKLNFEPVIDEYGRKCVRDGNEYGIYMSDNLAMVKTAYGNVDGHGVPINSNLLIQNKYIMIPAIGIIYEINTDGLDIRKPWISEVLTNVYNNGFIGNEWIADVIPAQNYKLYSVKIGKDVLHDEEEIDLQNVENLSDELMKKLEMRKYRLETFANAMKNLPTNKRNLLNREEMNILKAIYGENGYYYFDENSFNKNDLDGMLNYLISKVIKQDKSTINFNTIKYINSLRDKATNVNSIIDILNDDRISNMNEKLLFVERKKSENETYGTSKFDLVEKRIVNLISLFNASRKGQSEVNNIVNEEQDSEVTERNHRL